MFGVLDIFNRMSNVCDGNVYQRCTESGLLDNR